MHRGQAASAEISAFYPRSKIPLDTVVTTTECTSNKTHAAAHAKCLGSLTCMTTTTTQNDDACLGVEALKPAGRRPSDMRSESTGSHIREGDVDKKSKIQQTFAQRRERSMTALPHPLPRTPHVDEMGTTRQLCFTSAQHRVSSATLRDYEMHLGSSCDELSSSSSDATDRRHGDNNSDNDETPAPRAFGSQEGRYAVQTPVAQHALSTHPYQQSRFQVNGRGVSVQTRRRGTIHGASDIAASSYGTKLFPIRNRLSTSGSSTGCSTTASLASAQSTASSIPKTLRSSFLEDLEASSLRRQGDSKSIPLGPNSTETSRHEKLSARSQHGAVTTTASTASDHQEDAMSIDSGSFGRNRTTAGGSSPAATPGVKRLAPPGVGTSLPRQPAVTARSSGEKSPRPFNDGGIEVPEEGEDESPENSNMMNTRGPPPKVIEASNSTLGRILRIVQRTVPSESGVICMQTRVEVIDTTLPESPTLFAVRHADTNLWGRQMKVHKNIILACRLAGVDVPVEAHIPIDAIKVFEQTDNAQHMHAYLERIVPHIKMSHISKDVQFYWWRAVGHGLAVLQNRATGKMLLLRNPDRTIPSAVDCVCRMVNLEKLRGSSSFWERDENYPSPRSVQEELQDTASDDEDTVVMETDRLEKLINHQWAQKDEVSPWATSLIVRQSCARFIRYSIGTDFRSPTYNLLLQVHINEPLSRGCNAYPVCMEPMTLPSLKLHDVRLTYLQACWFLRKLFEFHSDFEAAQTGGSGAALGRTDADNNTYRHRHSLTVNNDSSHALNVNYPRVIRASSTFTRDSGRFYRQRHDGTIVTSSQLYDLALRSQTPNPYRFGLGAAAPIGSTTLASSPAPAAKSRFAFSSGPGRQIPMEATPRTRGSGTPLSLRHPPAGSSSSNRPSPCRQRRNSGTAGGRSTTTSTQEPRNTQERSAAAADGTPKATDTLPGRTTGVTVAFRSLRRQLEDVIEKAEEEEEP